MLDYSETMALPAPREPQPEASGMRPGNLSAIIERLEQTIDEETSGLRGQPGFDVKASNVRKGRHLFELTRAMKGVGPDDLLDEQKQSMIRLRGKLAENEIVLKAHLNAVGEVAGMIQNAIERAEADGTYSAGEFGRA
ncbi:MAG: hypothetical protein AB7S80_03725 [Rhizobiaceae bacterium]